MIKQDIFISQSEIAKRVETLAGQINIDYKDRALDIVCLINGASVFCADLIRLLTVPVKLHQLGFSSYSNANPSGEVRLTLDIKEPLHARHVLIMEGIVISGKTPRYIYDLLQLRRPSSLEICAFGIKPAALAVELPVKYVAFEFGPEMVVGYGIGDGPEKALPFLTVI